jgi:hypothetical protein
MYKSNFLLALATVLILSACKKEGENLFDLTFNGKITNQLTGAPIPGIRVHIVYGKACCGGIEKVLGRDSALTDATGRYSLPIAYQRDTSILYRHMVYVPGWQVAFRPLPPVNPTHSDWLTYRYEGKYAIPDDVKEVVKEGTVYNTDFALQPAGRLEIQLTPGLTIAPTDTIDLSMRLPGNNHPVNGDYLANFSITSDFPFALPIVFPVVAGKPNVLKVEIKKGKVKTTSESIINVSQGKSTTYTLKY